MSLLLVILLAAVLAWSFGTAGLMARWRETARLQLSLDACVRDHARAVLGNLRAVESSNRAMSRLRALIAVAPEPSAQTALRRALQVLAATQSLRRAEWEARRVTWTLRLCGERARLAGAGAFPWRTPPPDLLGPRPLEWAGPEPRCLTLRALRGQRGAAAALRSGDGGWSGRWVRARTGGCNES